jgi:hypothetical protein
MSADYRLLGSKEIRRIVGENGFGVKSPKFLKFGVNPGRPFNVQLFRSLIVINNEKS